jgi:hypothetical protein
VSFAGFLCKKVLTTEDTVGVPPYLSKSVMVRHKTKNNILWLAPVAFPGQGHTAKSPNRCRFGLFL